MKTIVLIPAHNAEKTVEDLIKQIKHKGFPVIVVDDGSTDETFQKAKNSGAIILKNEKNIGKGAALRRGFQYILNTHFDAVITMDADFQHDPAFLDNFIDKAESAGSVFILGNRMHKTKNMPWIRVVTNKFMSWLLSKRTGQYLPDTQCGFRFIKTDLLKKIPLSATGYDMESEIIIKAGKLGIRIDSVPISTIYTGQTSRINPFIDTLHFIKLILKYK